MSLFGAMFSGVSGLDAFGQAMGTIADNISNMNTVGYKKTETLFSTLVTTPATETTYTPGGVRANTNQLIDVQGLLQSSSSPTDLAIVGDGFFVVNEVAKPTSTTGQYQYTRAGAFTPDKDGNLRNTAGKYLQGWEIDANGKIPSNRSDLTALKTVNISGLTGTATKTDTVTLRANLQASQAVSLTGPQDATIDLGSGTPATGATSLTGTLTDGHVLRITVGSTNYDLTFKDTVASADQFNTLDELAALINAKDGVKASVAGTSPALLTVTGDPGNDLTIANQTGTVATTLFGGTPPTTTTKTYDASATAKRMSSGKVTPDFERSVQIFDEKGGARTMTIGFLKQEFANKWYTEVYIAPSTDTTATDGLLASGVIAFNTDGTLNLSNTSTALKSAITVPWAPAQGLGSQSVTINWGTDATATGMSQFDSASQLISFDVNGALFGTLTSVNVNENGVVIANFDNGVQKNLYKLPIATFPNPNGLQGKTGNAFIATDLSGNFNLNEAQIGGAGRVNGSSVESSTVDLADEFTTMIITQRAFSASGRIITTADDMLEELIRLKR